MTDNEIVKALECFTSGAIRCMYFYNDRFCRIKLIEEALDLINRQKKEIERLEKGELRKAMTFNNETIKSCTHEAIKEFAKKLEKVFSFYYQNVENISVESVKNHIDNLVKEMPEQRKGDEGK